MEGSKSLPEEVTYHGIHSTRLVTESGRNIAADDSRFWIKTRNVFTEVIKQNPRRLTWWGFLYAAVLLQPDVYLIQQS